MRRSTAAALVVTVVAGVSCGGRQIEVHPLVQLQPRPAQSAVYLFVREEAPPACPWEVVGSIVADQGWLNREADREDVEQAVRTMGGQGVLLVHRDDSDAHVIRFLDPISICDPAPSGSEFDR